MIGVNKKATLLCIREIGALGLKTNTIASNRVTLSRAQTIGGTGNIAEAVPTTPLTSVDVASQDLRPIQHRGVSGLRSFLRLIANH